MTAGSEEPPSRAATHERARGEELVANHTQAHDTSSFHPRRASDPALRRKPVVASRLPVGCDSESGERNTQSPCSADHRTIVTDRGPAASREALPVVARGIASDPVPMKPLRFREPPHRTQPGLPHRPEAATEDRVHERTCRDHDMWSARQTHTPGGDDRIRPKAGVRRLAAGIEDTFPRFGYLSAESDMPIVTRWLTTPAPSALRVSHPLSGLIPAHPRGCISSHIRP
jgi:hypothetical protein